MLVPGPKKTLTVIKMEIAGIINFKKNKVGVLFIQAV